MIIVGDCLQALREMPEGFVQTCVTSPPYYGLRDYGVDGQIGLEETPDAYVTRLVEVFREVRRVLRDDGTLWLNLGDSYAGSWGNQGRKAERGTQRPINGPMMTPVHDGRYASKDSNTGRIPEGAAYKAKDLFGIPWMVAFALRADGWYLRSEIIWAKPNPMPEPVKDRPTKAHEQVFLFSKSSRYFYDAVAIMEDASGEAPGNTKAVRAVTGQRDSGSNANLRGSLHTIGARDKRNARTVWTIPPRPFSGAHFATMPPTLAERCVLAGSRPSDVVLDPFGGAGTTGFVANQLGRGFILCELNPAYARLAKLRIGVPLTLTERAAELEAALADLQAALEAA